ncbi:MAG TPA: hypothetical protein VHY09_02150 [Candidatus Methylacidiphilales bacterium]|jgi:hypothetical protein|nr:hypothetical protein [Candidatus Methylacidiphilales bacterium]
MNEPSQPIDYDMQAAWLRRLTSDIESNLGSFARRLKEAMPDRVTLLEKKSLFSGPKLTGVSVEIGERKYTLEVDGRKLKASVAMVVRGITLNTKSVDPAQWFSQLSEETMKTTEHARSFSQSLSSFMVS